MMCSKSFEILVGVEGGGTPEIWVIARDRVIGKIWVSPGLHSVSPLDS